MFRVLAVSGGVVLVLGVLTSFCHPWMTLQGAFPGPLHQSVDVEAIEVCTVEDPELNEASGLAMSLQHKDAVWIHNDSGDTARLFLVGLDGKTRAIVHLNQHKPLDWEDMCSFEIDGQAWLLIGDIGDNSRNRGTTAPPCQLLLVKEPKSSLAAGDVDAKTPPMVNVEVHAILQFSFPDGPADCESLAVDTERREILLLTKTEPANCRLFRLPLSLTAGKTAAQAELLASIPVPYATAMDISRDGRQLAIINMFSGAMLNRKPHESWTIACANPVKILMLPARPQGETVCFEPQGKTLLINSERARQPLWRITLPQSDSKSE